MTYYRSNPAYLTSVFLHGTLIVLALAFVYWRSIVKPDPAPTVFELVAGEGDEYGATEAPALGTPGGIKITVPEIPRPEPTPTVAPPEPEPEPVIQAAPEPAPKAAAAIKSPTIPNMARNIERLADKREANIRKKVEQDQKTAQKKAADAAKRLTKEEFDRMNAGKKSSPKATTNTPLSTKRIDAEGIAKGVAGGSTANTKGGAGGTALSRSEGDLTEAYAALIVQRIRQALESASFNDVAAVMVQFQVSATGVISGARIVQSSGNTEFDQAIIKALQTIRPVGPPPTGRAETFRIPIRLRER
jgi:colicin import membrane protein